MILKGGKGFEPQCSVCLTTFITRSNYCNFIAQTPEVCPICDTIEKARKLKSLSEDRDT